MVRELKPCGTYAAYVRHIVRREKPCESCSQANRDYKNGLRVRRPLVLKPCGTWAAYQRHRRHGEEACRLCKDAANAYHAGRLAAARKAAEAGS